MGKPISVIVIDDSLLIRQMLTEILSSDPSIKVVASAEDAFDAREKIKQFNPDVITLDIEMPKMDGVSFLEKIMALRPMPVVMISTLTQKGADTTLRALEMGAVDYVAKPTANSQSLKAVAQEIIEKVKAAASAKVRATAKGSADVIPEVIGKKYVRDIIAIGSSTGGVEAIKEVLTRLPGNLPPIVIVQHMPAKFTTSFAKRLDSVCTMKVEEARNGTILAPGHVYIAPGDKHMKVEFSSPYGKLKVKEGEKISGHCPSVDVLFESIAKEYGNKTLGVMLTGMGKDGANGMLNMRKNGAFNIGQDEKTCVVYGMPKAVMDNNAVHIQKPLTLIAQEIMTHTYENK
jgi:two-component system chemotaxis response regulator CheB